MLYQFITEKYFVNINLKKYLTPTRCFLKCNIAKQSKDNLYLKHIFHGVIFWKDHTVSNLWIFARIAGAVAANQTEVFITRNKTAMNL